ncbi:MAG: sugar phosphate isomerase/epimerase [Myxococcota bacterium]
MHNADQIRIGCCCDAAQISVVSQGEYDYLEITLSILEDGIRAGQNPAEIVEALPAPAEVLMGMFPRNMALLGPNANRTAIMDRARFVIDLAVAANVQQLVLGAGKVRSIPDSMSREDGLRELCAILKEVSDTAVNAGLHFSIENIAAPASNVFNTLPEIEDIFQRFGLDSVGITFDTAQAAAANDPLEGMLKYSTHIHHVHVPVPFPNREEALALLAKAGYQGRISVEPTGLQVDEHAHATAAEIRSHIAGG